MFAKYLGDELKKTHTHGQPVDGYIADDDALPGSDIFDEFDHVVKSAEYTICIIDEPFLTSGFSKFKNKVAFKHLLDHQTGTNRRFIALAVGVDIDRILEQCSNLQIDAIVPVSREHYKEDLDWLDKVKRVLFGQNARSNIRQKVPTSHVLPIRESADDHVEGPRMIATSATRVGPGHVTSKATEKYKVMTSSAEGGSKHGGVSSPLQSDVTTDVITPPGNSEDVSKYDIIYAVVGRGERL